MSRAVRPSGRDRERRELRRRSPSTSPAPAAGRDDMIMLTLGTGVGGGVVLDGKLYPRLGRVRPHRHRVRRRAVPGRVHGARPPRGVRHGRAADALAQEAFGPAVDAHRLVRLADEGTSRRSRSSTGSAGGSARASARSSTSSTPSSSSSAAASRLPGELPRRPARSRSRGARRSTPPARALQIVRAELGTMAGPDRRRAASRSSAPRLMLLAVCATPIGNLEDVTLRVLARAARGGRRPLRGHAAHARPARAARHPARRCSATTSTTRRSGRRSSLPRLVAGERVALVSDAGLPGHLRPGRAAGRARRSRRACRSPCCPGRRRSRRRSSRAGSSASATSSSATCRAARRRSAPLWEELARWPWPVVAFESPQRLPRTLRSLAARCPTRPVAVCRELTKRFEEVVRGTGRGSRGPLRGAAEGRDQCSSSARAERRAWTRPPAPRLCGARRAPACRARQAAELVARLTGASRTRSIRRSL